MFYIITDSKLSHLDQARIIKHKGLYPLKRCTLGRQELADSCWPIPIGRLKVRLRWFGAVLQCKCKCIDFPCTFNVTIIIIHH